MRAAPGEQPPTATRISSVLDLARSLIRVPSQGGIDPPGPVIGVLADWLEAAGIPSEILRGHDGEPVGVCLEIGTGGRPRYCLNACLDTAPFGDTAAWPTPPTSAIVSDGWLLGRGSADSKVAAAIFAHLAGEVAAGWWRPEGTLAVLFDADEHTGGFGGIRAYVDGRPAPDGVLIGYPGIGSVAVGGRGFWRARVVVSGTSEHTGSRDPRPDNAIVKAAAFVHEAARVALPAATDPGFPLAPKLTVTGIHGGEGPSIVPDVCVVELDLRLTPALEAAAAEALVRRICEGLDRSAPSREPTRLEVGPTWPAYRLPESSPAARALRESARDVLGRGVPAEVVGPSNIGNYLASLGIEATCGFGVNYRNLHAVDERIEVATVLPVYEIYRRAVTSLLGG